ncbi:MAG TPA: tetratricopeptide repeat protein, partial [Herpetosiphonaceae bacterium]|nr:tetratricopeptide repeat protein [Herpetosiphonaceae bacterium]
ALREQETTLIRQRDDYAGAVREQARTVATDLERSNQVYHAALARQRGQRERFVNKSSLTLDLAMFRDRVQERAQVLALLASPAARVVQIVGHGGMGKTALASYALLTIEQHGFAPQAGGPAFHALIFRAAHAQGGLKFEQLISDIARVCPDVAEPLAALAQSGDYAAQATALLDIAGEIPLLLVLDNCETLMDADGHIHDAGMAALLEAVLRPNHAWRMLLTSRRALAVSADQQRYLHQVTLRDGLPTADAITFLRDLDPGDTTPIRRTPVTVLAQIITRLHGRPRLLEQCVALLKTSTYTPEHLLARPELLETLTQTLHDWLTAGERAIVEALAVFGVPVARDALEYVLLPEYPALAVDATLAHLGTSGVISHSDGMFGVHPLDAEAAVRSGKGAVPDAGAPALPRLNPTPEPQEAPLWWGMKLLRTLFPWTRKRVPDNGVPLPPPSPPSLHERAADYYQLRELPSDQWRTIEDLAPQIARAEHLTAAGLCDAAAEVLRGIDFDYLQLWGHAARVIRLREPLVGRLTRPALQMSNDNNLGLCYADVGRVREAMACYQRGLHRAQQQDDNYWQSTFLGNLGMAYYRLGEVRRAIDYHEQALVISREMGNRRGEGADLGNLGNAYAALGEVRRAIDCYEQALVISREVGDLRGEGADLGNMGIAYAALGEVRRAIDLYEQVLVLMREIGDRSGESNGLVNMAVCYTWLEDDHKADHLLATGYLISNEVGDPYITSDILITQGLLFRHQGNLSQARERYAAALALDYPQTAGRAAWGCGLVAALQEELNQAQAHWEDTARRCVEMRQVAEYRYLAGAVDIALAAIMSQESQAEVGLSILRAVLAEAPLPQQAAEILRDLRDVARALGETTTLTEAIALLEPIAAQMRLE